MFFFQCSKVCVLVFSLLTSQGDLFIHIPKLMRMCLSLRIVLMSKMLTNYCGYLFLYLTLSVKGFSVILEAEPPQVNPMRM